MNIFATDDCPTTSALALDDIRVNKMIVESAQILSTALRRHGYEGSNVYKTAYPKHPSTIWGGNCRGNFLWLCQHAAALCSIYYRNTRKNHKTFPIIKVCFYESEWIPEGPRELFVLAASDVPEDVKRSCTDVPEAYRAYMNRKWQSDTIKLTWKHRGPPKWKI